MTFDELTIRHATNAWHYGQRFILSENSLTNPILRMSPHNRDGICLGLAMAFLLYSKRCTNEDPYEWVHRFIVESSSGYYGGGDFYNVTDLQVFIASIMQDQRNAQTPAQNVAARITPLQEGMWYTSLRHEQTCTANWGGNPICNRIIPHLSADNAYWLIALYSPAGGHAISIRSMLHPKSGSRVFILYEPNHGIVQFDGIVSLHKLKDFLVDFAASAMGRSYAAATVDMYRFV